MSRQDFRPRCGALAAGDLGIFVQKTGKVSEPDKVGQAKTRDENLLYRDNGTRI
jgi:hypothetical protein